MLLLGILLINPLTVLSVEEELVLGVFPRRNAMQTVSTFTPLAEYLGASLKRPVRLETAGDFDSFWEKVSQQRYDIVHYNQYHYLRSHKTLGYQVVAMNQEFGRATVRASVTVKRNMGITSVADLRGKKIVFGGGPHAMLNYILPTYLLAQAGLRPDEYEKSFARHPCNSIVAVCVEQAPAAGTNDAALSMSTVAERCDTGTLVHLLQSKPLAQLPWAVSPELSADLRVRIRKALLGARRTSEGRAALASAEINGLVPASDSDYEPYRAIVQQVTGEQY